MSFFNATLNFIMDTETPQHICNNRNLSVANITKCTGITIGGIGVGIQAKGTDSIKLETIDS